MLRPFKDCLPQMNRSHVGKLGKDSLDKGNIISKNNKVGGCGLLRNL